MIIGYTTGVYDLFHIGHLNILNNAKAMCDKLIVGVSTDELVQEHKHKKPVISFSERTEIVRNIKCVDSVVAQETYDKEKMHSKLKFDVMIVGDDWHETEKWQDVEKSFAKKGVRIVYFPYTTTTSSTLINETLIKLRNS